MQNRNRKSREATARYWGKSLENPEWYSIIKAEDDDGELEIFIYDVIGWPFNEVEPLVQELAENLNRPILVRINSPGGDVFDGMALYNSFRDHPAKVTTRIEGLAASMASVVALAGDEVTAHQSAMLMIHEPWAFALGDQHELRAMADVLGKISVNLLDVYYGKTGSDKRKLKQEMADETWFTAEEAKTRKLIDAIVEQPAEKKAFDLSMFVHAPDGYQPEGRDLNEREIERALRDAGASRTFAKNVIATKFKTLRDAEVEDMNRQIRTIIEAMKG